MKRLRCATFAILATLLFSSFSSAQDKLDLPPGTHISLIGNTLADRQQHDGWLDTYLHSRFPKANLVIRNLGFSGDELTLRLRSANFGSPDQWLTKNETDVLFAFFGYNESFGDAAGLERFKKDLDAFLKRTREQKYNGKTPPRLVLFSPIAHENLNDRNLPAGSENNLRLELYTDAMAEVARANKVLFVDLFRPTRDLYAKEAQALTINGVHLNDRGHERLAAIIDRALFPTPINRNPQQLAKLREAVKDRNFTWFQRYRTTDGYSIYGGRADLKFMRGQTNREVAQREMEVLDVMTANRDQRVWAVAQGKDTVVNDDNTPPFIPVETNKPGPLPGGKHVFVNGEDAAKQMTVAKGMKVNLFASEKEFPDLVNPVQMTFDAKGRLWVAVWPTYPHWKPKEEMNDKLLILEDTNGDGKADKQTVFADKLHNPTGFELVPGGVLIAQAPDLLLLKDTNGDDKADVRLRVLHGLDSADTHHTSNSFVVDPGGAVYFQEGTFHHTQVETPYGPPQRCVNAGVFRYEPRTQKFDVYVSFGFANPHGHVFDRWGQDIVVDGTGAQPYHAALFSGHLDYPMKHARPPQVYQQRTRPCPGMEYLSSRHFPEANQGNLLVPNVIGFQGILQYKMEDKGASYTATEVEPIVSSTDPNFRPSDLKIGPDGAIYFLDWHNPIIGHMQHNLRDPSRDREHGRIFRVTYEGRPLLKPVDLTKLNLPQLLDTLKEPEDRVRSRARTELGARDTDQVVAALKTWIAGLDPKDPNLQHHLLEALWLHQNHNVVNEDLLKRLLISPEFRTRAAATRVLCYWRDRVADALEILKKQAADAHPRVRLEAIRAASFFPVAEAVEVPLVAMEHPTDVYLDFVRGETMKALDPHVRKAIAEGRKIAFSTPAGARYFLKSVATEDLLKMTRDAAVYNELLQRRGVREELRREAVTGLAGLRKQSELRVLLDSIKALDLPQKSQDEPVLFDLIRLLTSRPTTELATIRDDLEKLATAGNVATTRQLGFVALIAADGKVDRAWSVATKSAPALQDLVRAMPLLRDPEQRAALYPKVLPLLNGLPKELATATSSDGSLLGRYVRIDLPGRRKVLTLAEVEVLSDGRNVARQGKATQKNTAHDGTADRAIDGNKSGRYGDGGMTHSEENTDNPWWEVDLGKELPIHSIVVYNRAEGFSNRLNGFRVQVLDANRKAVFMRDRQNGPPTSVTFAVSSEAPERLIRRAAMQGLISVRGQEQQTFKTLAGFLSKDDDRAAAIEALLKIPTAFWPKDQARPVLDTLLTYVGKVPVAERTRPAVLDALQLAESLAALLPREEARTVRRQLGELGVRVLRVGTVPDQMIFDKDRLVVKAGRPVELIFENSDLMPHNFVILQPGSLEEIGNLAETTATQPGALERHYVPQSPKVLFASKLIQPREVQQARFTAPTKPGVYPYVCTYPGHWRRMYGALYVVEDLDDYLTDPEAYLASHPMPAADELLKFIRPRKEWKLEELAPAVAALQTGRSFTHAKQAFQAASCVSCHKLNGVGVEIGPDLTKYDEKLKPIDLLKELLDPSARINEKYQTFVLETEAGKLITGLILEETKDELKVIENPLAKAEPIVLKKSDIVSRQKSPQSIMPKGLLDRLTREEILDLIAYLVARGDAKHKVFQGGHEH